MRIYNFFANNIISNMQGIIVYKKYFLNVSDLVLSAKIHVD